MPFLAWKWIVCVCRCGFDRYLSICCLNVQSRRRIQTVYRGHTINGSERKEGKKSAHTLFVSPHSALVLVQQHVWYWQSMMRQTLKKKWNLRGNNRYFGGMLFKSRISCVCVYGMNADSKVRSNINAVALHTKCYFIFVCAPFTIDASGIIEWSTHMKNNGSGIGSASSWLASWHAIGKSTVPKQMLDR